MVSPVSPQLIPSPQAARELLPLLPPGGEDLFEKVRYAERVLQPFLPKPSKQSNGSAVIRYMDGLNHPQPAVSDINAVLGKLRSESSPLERGVVGPTGASATVSFGVLGPIFGIYGFGAGVKIIHNARKANSYLGKLDGELKAREQELETLKTASLTDPSLQLTIAELTSRIFILQEFRRGVQLSVNEQRFNMTFPGVVQLTASSMILVLAVDLVPTLGGASAVFSAAATLTFGVLASSVLGVYAGGSFLKNGYQLGKTFGVPHLKPEVSDSKEIAEYKAVYNKRIQHMIAFYGLNTVSWGIYVAGAAVLVAALAGSVASHALPEVMVVTGALAAVIWDAVWGKEFAPHNTLAPHIDRNYLDNMQRRMELWKLLTTERGDLEKNMRSALASLPNTHSEKPVLWKKLSKTHRYKYFWKILPKRVFTGGSERFARWCVKDAAIIDPIVVGHMKEYTDHEINYLQNKLIGRTAEVTLRILEFTKAREAGTELNYDTLKDLLLQDGMALQQDELKLSALNGLRTELATIDVAKVHTVADDKAAWTKVRLEYMAIHGMLDNFVTRDQLYVHPDWYTYQSQTGRSAVNKTARLNNKQLTVEGLDALSERGFTAFQEKLFIRVIADLNSNRYETATVFGMERAAQKKIKKEQKKARKAAGDKPQALAAAPA